MKVSIISKSDLKSVVEGYLAWMKIEWINIDAPSAGYDNSSNLSTLIMIPTNFYTFFSQNRTENEQIIEFLSRVWHGTWN